MLGDHRKVFRGSSQEQLEMKPRKKLTFDIGLEGRWNFSMRRRKRGREVNIRQMMKPADFAESILSIFGELSSKSVCL